VDNNETLGWQILIRNCGTPLALLSAIYPASALIGWWSLLSFSSSHPQAGHEYASVATTEVFYTSPLGSIGAWAVLLSVVWLLSAAAMWIRHRMDGKALTGRARAQAMTLLAVVVAAVAVSKGLAHYASFHACPQLWP
jgi:hypothetical protein